MRTKKLIFTFLLLFAILLLPNIVNAFTYDGINYNVLDEDTVEVSGYDTITPPTELEIPSTVWNGTTEYTVTAIGNYAFASCTSLTTVKLPETVTSIGIAAFNYCSNLTTINLSDKITEIERYAFNECTSLKNVQIPNSIKSIGERTFYNCIGLETIIIPETLESLGEEAFHSYSYTNASRKAIILNPELVFSGSRQFSWIIKIYGFKDSTAEEFAGNNYNKFEAFYSVKNSLNNITRNGLSYAHSVLGDYKATLSAEEGYALPENIEINANGNILEENVDYTYDKSNGNILIYAKSITGDIEIIASGETLISKVEITSVTMPVCGQKPTFTGKVPESANYKINLEFWYDETGKEVTEEFEEGKTYTYYCMVNPISNSRFGSVVKATVNGNDMKFESNEGNLLVFSYKVKASESINNNGTTDKKDEIINNNNEASGEKDETPSTGNIADGIALQLYVLSIISLILVLVIKKLRKNK